MPSDQSEDQLRSVLRTDPPPGVAALDQQARDTLAGVIKDARKRQGASLEESFTATLKHVPFPVRGVVKKVLLG